MAQVTGTANSTTGSYTVVASSAGATTPVNFNLTNIVGLSYSGLSNPTITYGTASTTISGNLAEGSNIPVGDHVTVTLDGVPQDAVIGASGRSPPPSPIRPAWSWPSSPYVVGYAFPSQGSFPAANSTSSLTVHPATPVVHVTDSGGTFNNTPFPATATVTGVGGSPASNLEGFLPTLSYYNGTYTSAGQLAGLIPLAGAPSNAGSYTVLATFPGSPDYAAAESTPVNFVIGGISATIALASSASSAIFGQSVLFVATVSAFLTPTGTVTFFDGGTSVGTPWR